MPTKQSSDPPPFSKFTDDKGRRFRYVADMKHDSLIAWTSIYIAVGIMALICAVLSVLVTANDWRTGQWRPALDTRLEKILILPKIWLRWQVNYLRGAPVVLAIAVYYASHVGFSVFWDL